MDDLSSLLAPGRLKMLLFTYLARAAIASLLLGAGIRWLAGTTSITDSWIFLGDRAKAKQTK